MIGSLSIVLPCIFPITAWPEEVVFDVVVSPGIDLLLFATVKVSCRHIIKISVVKFLRTGKKLGQDAFCLIKTNALVAPVEQGPPCLSVPLGLSPKLVMCPVFLLLSIETD